MTNEEIARRFERLALVMEIRGDDKFRVRSYRNAAEMIETWPSPVEQIAREEGLKGLQSLPGVGKAISGKIVELLDRGTFDAWERLKEETPETVLDLLEVEGLRPLPAVQNLLAPRPPPVRRRRRPRPPRRRRRKDRRAHRPQRPPPHRRLGQLSD
jgi:DNA polymerase/3'-5' exonuclease PolX